MSPSSQSHEFQLTDFLKNYWFDILRAYRKKDYDQNEVIQIIEGDLHKIISNTIPGFKHHTDESIKFKLNFRMQAIPRIMNIIGQSQLGEHMFGGGHMSWDQDSGYLQAKLKDGTIINLTLVMDAKQGLINAEVDYSMFKIMVTKLGKNFGAMLEMTKLFGVDSKEHKFDSNVSTRHEKLAHTRGTNVCPLCSRPI